MDVTEYLRLEKSQLKIESKLKFLESDGLDWYKNQALNLFELKNIPKKNNDNLIQQILSKSPNDDVNKKKGKEYYVSNFIVFIHEIKKYLIPSFIDSFRSDNLDNLDNLIVYNYHRILQYLLFDSIVLLNEYAMNVKNIDPIYSVGKGYSQHTLTLYQSLKQSIYGQASFHSFIDVEPDLSISIIRQLIELRIRRAFGILGCYDENTKSMTPIPMNKIFSVIGKFKEDIDLSIPFDCLVRIYGWSNIFLHAGIKEYSWKYIFVTSYLEEFSLGKRPSKNGWSVNSGIAIKADVLDKIINEIESDYSESVEIIKWNPESIELKA